ncbi:hypothetical protein Sme01_50330 [Sphaerisporangium melleum]|uniref:DUF3592 domain-containing protein n=1 Tax=Sphaerisporangium melleum TaxID=321316 RepID=A0A917R554_9ACTN|nr:DUF3592 domain-containing protein [Sphaerisporangium melleum]GGK89925.1 hypothetical protein GCM10007964_35740 [Sphaerisporangium melleum]GII72557.1 hypothetical protein Sme01_50330 [Sphaerisporangium melleum]
MSTTAWIVLGFGLIALVFGGIGAGLLVSEREFRRIAHRVPGQVVRLRPHHDDGSTTYYPTIRFVTAHGQPVEAEPRVSSNPPVAPVGGAVTVLYDPAAPTRIRLDSFWHGGSFLGVLFAGIGVTFLAVDLVMVLVNR